MSTARSMALAAQRWTPTLVAERLAEAADVLARLPDQRVRGLYDLWPRLVGEPYGHARAAAAAPEAIDRMDEALGWLMWLEPEERQLVWLRAEGLPWKWITRRLGHRPHHGMATVDHGPAQDRGPSRHGRTDPSGHQTPEQPGRFCARKRVASDEVRETAANLTQPARQGRGGFLHCWSRRCLASRRCTVRRGSKARRR